ncbi:MAG: MaoC/PaaZ C-terminal domain-containing protein [Thermaerobacter sp.]|nr:MaoC/PaaZ C-terminal domain-containing protein [Thermaerobacter sp.]
MYEGELSPGQELQTLVKASVTKVQLLRYAGASGDDNLIHTDVETAKSVGLDGVIAHGMLSMGFLGQFLTDLAGPDGVKRLSVRFAGMVHLGDVISCKGVVRAVERQEGDRTRATLAIWAENQQGERVTTGEAEIWLAVRQR